MTTPVIPAEGHAPWWLHNLAVVVSTSTIFSEPIPLNPPLEKGGQERTQRGFAPLHALMQHP